MRTYLRRAFRSGGLMEKRFWKRAYFWRATNMHLCIGAFIAAMELSQADLIVEFTQYFVLILY